MEREGGGVSRFFCNLSFKRKSKILGREVSLGRRVSDTLPLK